MILVTLSILVIYIYACFGSYDAGKIKNKKGAIVLSILCFLAIIAELFIIRQIDKGIALQQIPKDLLNGKIEYRINNTIENSNIIKSDTIYFYKK